jgi:hypothetical protein
MKPLVLLLVTDTLKKRQMGTRGLISKDIDRNGQKQNPLSEGLKQESHHISTNIENLTNNKELTDDIHSEASMTLSRTEAGSNPELVPKSPTRCRLSSKDDADPQIGRVDDDLIVVREGDDRSFADLCNGVLECGR